MIDAFVSFYKRPCSVEEWNSLRLDNIEFNWGTVCRLDGQNIWEMVMATIFKLARDEAVGLHGFPMCFFQYFWDLVKEDIMEFLLQVYNVGRLQ